MTRRGWGRIASMMGFCLVGLGSSSGWFLLVSFVGVTLVAMADVISGYDWSDSNVEYKRGIKEGYERSALYLDKQFYDCSPLATALRTLKDGGVPCEDCGWALPQHDPSCVARPRVKNT